MGRSLSQTWTWTLYVLVSWMCGGQVLARPQYMVAIPAVLEAGTETKFCASLLQPDESLVMTITLIREEKNTTLLSKTSSEEFHDCFQFKVPAEQDSAQVYTFAVEVKGDTFYSREVRNVMTQVYQPISFIRTDKPIYLPGQTVHFRVVTLDLQFRPIKPLYSIIEVEDASQNRIAQWLNETSDDGIVQHSFSLNSEAREGHYQVIVTVGNKKIQQGFDVEKYVLPKFDAEITSSDAVSIDQEDAKAEICATYTYGQPVPGTAKVKMCRPVNPYFGGVRAFGELSDLEIKAPCHEEIKELDKKGCATVTVKMSTFTKMDMKPLEDQLDLTAEVEEQGTGISQKRSKRMEISYVIGKLSFIDTPKIYDKGSKVEGKVKAVYFNDTPIPDKDLYLFEGERWSPRRLQNLTTDSNGIATFSFSTENMEGDISLHVSNEAALGYSGYRVPYYQSGHHAISVVQIPSADTKTVSSLEVKKKDKPLSCDTEEDIVIKYTVVLEEGPANLIYLVLSRGAIVMQGIKKFDVEKNKQVTEGEVSFKLNVKAELAPVVQVVAYAVLPSMNVIAHSEEFATEKCFSHKVSLEFSPSSAVPGEETTMQVSAQPDSLCGISAVDQSVLIKKPGNTLNAENIFNLLPKTKATYIPYEVNDPVECLHVRPKRYVLPYPPYRGEKNDAFTVFQNVGLKMATNLFIRMPSCLMFRGRQYHEGIVAYRQYDSIPVAARMETQRMASPGQAGPMVGMVSFSNAAPPPLPAIETVRTFFPETWIWDLVRVGASGTKDVALTVPDTITTWETEAFCLSPQGFGLAPRKEIKVFQPFFLELTLPYSIIRGEHFELKATTFNYLSSCLMVTVSPKSSSEYTLTPLSGDQYTSCLCGNERKTLKWTMAPTVLGVMNVSVTAEAVPSHATCDNEIVSVPERGRIDLVTRSLIVKAEGTEMSKAHNWLLCPKEETLTEEIELQLPENVIVGSARASISVMGDILGRALKNLDGLLQMPYGCGEQNMALLAPNIYILQYLKNTDQLTPDIMAKATNFLTSGYQRQLNYKHNDGAYSTFGSGDGNTWLTAFVMRSFAKAKSFIYIDPNIIEVSKTWLENKQQENGCFQQIGKLFNNRMKGGVSNSVTLSAYITAAFLEMNVSADDPVVKRSLSCLNDSISSLKNTYTTALMAYVFTLAGDMETRDLLLQQLDQTANREGGLLYWSQKHKKTSSSLAVEISSYVILAKLSASPTSSDLGYTSGIIRWLTGQQNSYGGFSSTQDTVVALQALALYSTLVFSSGGESTVQVQTPSRQLTFNVNQNNKLLYQEETLQDVTGKHSLVVKGNACVSMQISLHYNIPTPEDDTIFKVEVKPVTVCSSQSQRHKLSLELKSLYRGGEASTNMVILDIKMLSGFVPDSVSLRQLKGALLVDRVEEKEDRVLVYLQELPKDIPINHKLDLIQELPVQNLKPAVVKIYDYYQPNDHAEVEYLYPCTAD